MLTCSEKIFMWLSRVNNAPYLDMGKEETESSRSCSILALLLGSAVLCRIKKYVCTTRRFCDFKGWFTNKLTSAVLKSTDLFKEIL